MCCLSKGLCAPVGSLLAGDGAFIAEARAHRSRMGGTMRQAGVIGAAGLVALRTMIDRLAEDHRRAAELAGAVQERWPAAEITPPQTNIVTFAFADADALLDHLNRCGILAGTTAPGMVRFVTHHDVDDDGIRRACDAIKTYGP
jgi:threonine aldolase